MKDRVNDAASSNNTDVSSGSDAVCKTKI